MIVRNGELWTHPADQFILGSITRAVLLDLARSIGVPVREQTFTVNDLLSADEAFVCGTTSHVTPLASIDGKTIGRIGEEGEGCASAQGTGCGARPVPRDREEGGRAADGLFAG